MKKKSRNERLELNNSPVEGGRRLASTWPIRLQDLVLAEPSSDSPSSPLLGRQPSTGRSSANNLVDDDTLPLITLSDPIADSVSSDQNLALSTGENLVLHRTSQPLSGSLKTADERRGSSCGSSCLERSTYASVSLLHPWIPNVDPTDPRAKTFRTRKARRAVVLRTCLATASTIAIINFVLGGLVWSSRFQMSSDGVVTLYQGDCTIVKRADTLTHLLINTLSTLLMGASNLALQLIAAPSRKDIDKAHSAGIWLDIGVPSLRNLSRIPRVSLAIWCCLALSSIPIHFLYNATIFSSISTNDIAWVVATEQFLTGELWPANTTDGKVVLEPGSPAYRGVTIGQYTHGSMPDDGSFAAVSSIHNDYHENTHQYANSTTYDCLREYYAAFGWRPSQLIMISSNISSSQRLNSSALLAWGIFEQGHHSAAQPLCLSDERMEVKCDELEKLNSGNIGEVTFLDKDLVIDYCLFKPTDVVERLVKTCHLQCSPQILIVVACFNVVKCLCILWIIFRSHGSTLCILGDAIASFLETPDNYTKEVGVASIRSITHSGKDWVTSEKRPSSWQPSPIPWVQAPSIRRWLFAILTSIFFLIAGFSVGGLGLTTQRNHHRSTSMSNLWAMGFGQINVDEIIAWGQPSSGVLGVLVNTLIANTWQVIVSLLYINQNALLSCMLVAKEWSGFATNRKALRVSAPVGIQRSSYTLSMPMRYGIPMLIVFAVEHWLLSQTTFIVRANRFSWNGDTLQGWTMTGYSFIPALTAGLLYFCLVSAQLLVGVRRYPADPAMPFVSTCSAAISAACHRPEADKEAHLLPVQWGVVGHDQHGVQQCAFTTSRYVAPLEQGSLVFGMPDPVKRRLFWKRNK